MAPILRSSRSDKRFSTKIAPVRRSLRSNKQTPRCFILTLPIELIEKLAYFLERKALLDIRLVRKEVGPLVFRPFAKQFASERQFVFNQQKEEERGMRTLLEHSKSVYAPFLECLTIELYGTDTLEQDDYVDNMALLKESLSNFAAFPKTSISVSVKYKQITTDQRRSPIAFRMVNLENFVSLSLLPEVLDAGLSVDTFWLELNYHAAPRNASITSWINDFCSEVSGMTFDVKIFYYVVEPQKEREAYIHYYRKEKRIDAKGFGLDQFEEFKALFYGEKVEELVLSDCQLPESAFTDDLSIISEHLTCIEASNVRVSRWKPPNLLTHAPGRYVNTRFHRAAQAIADKGEGLTSYRLEKQFERSGVPALKTNFIAEGRENVIDGLARLSALLDPV